MQGEPAVVVCRLGHRPGRDDRMTTHVGLTARALGADRVFLPTDATGSADTIRDITDRFGGPFEVEVGSPISELREWDGTIAHLTMYGEPVQRVAGEVRETYAGGDPLLVAVGAEKVPFEVYERADWNVAVTNQPHSEVAGLAVFLDRLFEGRELDRERADADRVVVPQESGKRVEQRDGNAGANPGGTNAEDAGTPDGG